MSANLNSDTRGFSIDAEYCENRLKLDNEDTNVKINNMHIIRLIRVIYKFEAIYEQQRYKS